MVNKKWDTATQSLNILFRTSMIDTMHIQTKTELCRNYNNDENKLYDLQNMIIQEMLEKINDNLNAEIQTTIGK